MSTFYSILDKPAALLLLMIALVLLIGQTAVFLLSIQEKHSRLQIMASALHMLAGFLVFVIILDGFDNVNFESIPRESVQNRWFVYTLPWFVYVILEAVSALILASHFREYWHYRNTNVTPDAIRQSIDLLPEGICISAEDGTVLLVNLKMDALCRLFTGERPSDARMLWTYVEQTGEDQKGKRLIHTPQGEVWLFAKDDLTIENTNYERISAVDVTERYRITEELREKNAYLQEIRRRMKDAADLSAEMFMKQEEATARTSLHNELGQVLLMGRHCIEHPDSTDRNIVALMTRQMNRFLLGENKLREPAEEDELKQAVGLAGSIGVYVLFGGDVPQWLSKEIRAVLAQAIRECAANTVKHAEGDVLDVILSERSEMKAFFITITNNGRPPERPVSESGGLLALRRSVEAAGGRMTVQSLPRFKLELCFSV